MRNLRKRLLGVARSFAEPEEAVQDYLVYMLERNGGIIPQHFPFAYHQVSLLRRAARQERKRRREHLGFANEDIESLVS